MTTLTNPSQAVPRFGADFILSQIAVRPYLACPEFGTSALSAIYAASFQSVPAVQNLPDGTRTSFLSTCANALARCAAIFRPTSKPIAPPPDLVEIEDAAGNVPVERWAYDELVRMGKLEPEVKSQTLHALRMENALRAKHGDYKFGRSYREIVKLLDDNCSTHPLMAIRRMNERNTDAIPTKVLLIGDGEGRFAAGLKRRFGDDIDIKQVSLHPARPENAFAYSDQIIADLGSLGFLPEVDILFDVFGAAFHSKRQHNAMQMEMNSLVIGGIAFMITDSMMFYHLTTSGSSYPCGSSIMDFHGPPSRSYFAERKVPGFDIETHHTSAVFSRRIYVSVERTGPQTIKIDDLKV